ncbi:hypothetical protein [Cupriavidus sp. D39]|uniref:hypothetical protein n=1 Tax=Cupriavidus sp. D39 TaxID=2997877 RepID=UPI00226DD150|nr:hypothetical protein [Cupriavidus sp. D39]MCY0853355.1 hypothetical protein [Cupriavidus sp. D39]
MRIATLERQVALLTASHLAMLHIVGKLGGFGKWAAFYEHYADARAQLDTLGAVPVATITPVSTPPPEGKPPKRRHLAIPRNSVAWILALLPRPSLTGTAYTS